MPFVVLLLALLLGLTAPAWADNETLTDSVRLLRQRLAHMMPGSFMSAGCLPSLPVSALVFDPVACEGTVLASGEAVPVSQAAAAIGPLSGGNGTYWIALAPSAAGTVAGGWTRQLGTHYLWLKADVRPPAAGVAFLAKVTVASSVVTVVDDLRAPASLVRRGTYDVDDPLYGGVADDTTDVGPALRTALAASVSQAGPAVRLPAGRYALNSAVVIPAARGVQLDGDGWQAPPQNNITATVQPFRGTWIHIRATTFIPFTITGTGTRVSGIAFDHDQPVPTVGWAPNDYPAVLTIVTPATCCDPQTSAGDITLENLFFFKATRAVQQDSVGSQSAGRINIRDLRGQVFLQGILYNFVADVVRFQDIHLWPFWSTDDNVMLYQEQHMIGATMLRVDHPIFLNIFVFGGLAGLVFGSGPAGITSSFMGTNLDFDRVRYGLFISGGPGVTGQITNFNHSSGGMIDGAGYLTSLGISVSGDIAWVDLSNVNIQHVGSNCVSVTGANTNIALANFRCTDFNTGNGGAALQPAIATATSGKISLSGSAFIAAGHGGASFSPNVDGFTAGQSPGGFVFDTTNDFYVQKQSGGTLPTLSFAPSDYLQWVPSANQFVLGASAGTYMTGGVKKYVCIQDGALTVGTTCP